MCGEHSCSPYFVHVSGSLAGGMGFMCADADCGSQVQVEGNDISGGGDFETSTMISTGDAVFCSADRD